jgi:hypothetical protein
MQRTKFKTIGTLSMVIVTLVALFGGHALTSAQGVRTHADNTMTAASKMPTSFVETVDGKIYAWTLKRAASYTNTSVDSGTWDVRNGSTDLGTLDSDITATQNSSGVDSYKVNTTSTLPGIASILSGSSTEAIPENGPDHYRSAFNQSALANTNAGGKKAWEIDTDPDTLQNVEASTEDPNLGPKMFHNMSTEITREQQAYVEEKNLSTYQGDARNNTLAMASSRSMPLSFHRPTYLAILAVATAAFLLTVAGAVTNYVCNRNKCGPHSDTWAFVGGIVAITALIVFAFYGAAAAWLLVTEQAVGAAAGAAEGIAMGNLMAAGGPAVAATEGGGTMLGAVETAFPIAAITP